MKFLAATLAYVLMGLLLGWSVIMAVQGKLWLLGAVALSYIVAFAFFGCLPPKDAH